MTLAGPARSVDKDELKREIVAVCAHYLGPAASRSGRRYVWVCPGCAKKKFEATEAKGGVAGCWNAACAVPTSTDAIGLVAHFEGLDPSRDFREVLQRGAALLGLTPDPDAQGRPAKPRAARPQPPDQEPSTDPGLLDRVYGRLLELCPTSPQALRFWESRGVSPETVEWGAFGETTPAGTRAAVACLEKEFGREELTRTPGFFVNRKENLSFTLYGDYALIPYHDRDGRVTTIEGRALTEEQVRRTDKYISLRDSGSHLYVFPLFAAEDLEAFTEGPICAIVAAQAGLRVGSIKGIRCHRDARTGGPLPELAGAVFGGRCVPYIPDSDDPPKPEVVAEAPKAACSLTLPHEGRPALVTLPRGMDLDEWLLSMPEASRRSAFRNLLAAAAPVRNPKGEPDGEPEG